MILGRPIELVILEDNQATIKIVRKGYSSKLRHIYRTHKVNLGSIKEVLEEDNVTLTYCNTHYQAADVFTKALAPAAWQNALELLGIVTDASAYAVEGRVSDGQLVPGVSRPGAPPGAKGAVGWCPCGANERELLVWSELCEPPIQQEARPILYCLQR